MIEISRTHKFMGIDLKTAWGDVKAIVDKGAQLITPAAAAPRPVAPAAPAPSSTILGMPQGMVLLAGGLAVGAGILIYVMSKD